jgi:formiminoglutamase
MLPVLLSIPHGGTQQPPELAGRVCLSEEKLFDDSDAFTREIYDLGGEVIRVVTTEIARAFIDVNRAPDDRPPANPDGVIKSATCYGHNISHKGEEPGDVLVSKLRRQRPLFCLSNADGLTSPNGLLENMRHVFADAFECELTAVRLNQPFKGGFITRSHGRGQIPWVQVEMNRSLYLNPVWFRRETLEVEPGRLQYLRNNFRVALHALAL